MADTQTQVQQTDKSLDELLGTPGSENVLLPENKDGKTTPAQNMFKRDVKPDVTFLDTPGEESTGDEQEEERESAEEETLTTEELNPLADEPVVAKETEDKNKINKGTMVASLQTLIDNKVLQPFDDGKALKDYTPAEVAELIEANLKHREEEIKENFPREFFESLPDEFKYATEYLSKGGTDYKALFRALAGVEETRQLDPKNPNDQESIARQFLRATQFGTEDEISEEITGWKDRGELEAKASKFKPKLDKMQESVVNAQLERQEDLQRQQKAAAQNYMNNVYKALEPGILGDVKLDKKTQTMLYAGLVRPDYPSITGKNTNLLGHLLEKYQYTKEANPSLIAEALWLLADPDAYRAKIREAGARAQTEKTVKKLKTEEQSGNKGLGNAEEEEVSGKKKAGIPRINGNFFKRTT